MKCRLISCEKEDGISKCRLLLLSYPKYLHFLTPYRSPVKFGTNLSILLPFDVSKNCMTKCSVGPDQTPRSAASDQGLHCLLRSVSP